MQRLAFAPVVAGVLALGGCASYTAIEGSDYSVNTPFFRASVPVGDPGPWQKRLQLSVARQEAEFGDGVEAGKTVALNGTEFDGPTTLKAQATVTTAHVNVIFPIPVKEKTLRFEANTGATMIDSQLKVSDTTTAARLDDTRYGPSGGIAIILNTADQHFGVRAGIDHTWAGEVAFAESELLGIWAPTPSLEFLLGYRHFEYKFSELNSSNVYMTFSGPAAGINIRF